MAVWNKGKKLSEECRRKLSESHKGQIAGTFKKGHIVPEEMKIKISEANKGKHNSPNTEFKKGYRAWNTGTKGVMVAWNKGKSCPQMQKPRSKPRTEEHKLHLSASCKGRKVWNKDLIGFNAGSKHHNWKGGISHEEYGTEFNNQLKEQIRKRDQFRCQQCFRHQDELNYKLQIHHIDYNKKNNDSINLISLCRNCHCQTNYGRDDWDNYFTHRNEGRGL